MRVNAWCGAPKVYVRDSGLVTLYYVSGTVRNYLATPLWEPVGRVLSLRTSWPRYPPERMRSFTGRQLGRKLICSCRWALNSFGYRGKTISFPTCKQRVSLCLPGCESKPALCCVPRAGALPARLLDRAIPPQGPDRDRLRITLGNENELPNL